MEYIVILAYCFQVNLQGNMPLRKYWAKVIKTPAIKTRIRISTNVKVKVVKYSMINRKGTIYRAWIRNDFSGSTVRPSAVFSPSFSARSTGCKSSSRCFSAKWITSCSRVFTDTTAPFPRANCSTTFCSSGILSSYFSDAS